MPAWVAVSPIGDRNLRNTGEPLFLMETLPWSAILVGKNIS